MKLWRSGLMALLVAVVLLYLITPVLPRDIESMAKSPFWSQMLLVESHRYLPVWKMPAFFMLKFKMEKPVPNPKTNTAGALTAPKPV